MWRSNGERLLGSRLPGGYLDDWVFLQQMFSFCGVPKTPPQALTQHLTEFLRQLTSKVDIINSGVLLIASSILITPIICLREVEVLPI